MSLENSNLTKGLLVSEDHGDSSTQNDMAQTCQQCVLEVLQQTAKQAAGADIRSRYCKVALYYEIEEIREALDRSGQSTIGVNFPTMAIRKWIAKTENSNLDEKQVHSWKSEGERWKTLCDQFSAGILEVSHEVLSACISEPSGNYLDVLLKFCPSMRNRCNVWLKKVNKRLGKPPMNALLLDKWIDLEDKGGERDHTPAVAEAKTLEHLRTTHGPGASSELDIEIRESASRLFDTSARLTTCGSEIRVLKIEDASEKVGDEENSVAQGSKRRSDIDIEQENAELAAKAEQLCKERIAVADLGQMKDVYILPYQNAGVWHCVLRASDFVLNVSVSENRKMKTVHKDLRSNMIIAGREDVNMSKIVLPLP
ncbi:hypothetical protein KCU99_g9458, partial [Aureobasidium melanogenum]